MITIKEIQNQAKKLRDENGQGNISRITYYKGTKIIFTQEFINTATSNCGALKQGKFTEYFAEIIEEVLKGADRVEVSNR